MKYLFRRASDGVTILGDNPDSIYPGQLWVIPREGNIVDFRMLDGTKFDLNVDITTVKKENGEFYTDIEDFNAVSGTFFFKVTEFNPDTVLSYSAEDVDALFAALKDESSFLEELQDFGSDCKALPMGQSIAGFMAGTLTLEDGKLYEVAFRITKETTITGVKATQRTQGNYTADNYCGFGLHSTAAGVATKITETVNDGNLFKGADYSLITKAFPAPQVLQPGIYKVTLLWNASATTTAPVINQHSTLGLLHAFLLPNSNKISATLAAQTAIPATITASATSAHNSIPAIWLY